MAQTTMDRDTFDVPKLLEAALGGAVAANSQGRAAITALLKEVTRQTESFGCILWRQRQRDPEQLSYMGGWFQPERTFALPFVPRIGSIAGEALNQGWAMSNDLAADGNINAAHPFLVEFDVTRTFAIALAVRSEGVGDRAWPCVLNLYRQKSGAAFEVERDLPRFEKLAPLWGGIYQVVRYQTAYNLLADVNRIRQQPLASNGPDDALSAFLREFSGTVQRAFSAYEVSVFLESKDEAGSYSCAFTTEGDHATRTREKVYRAGLNQGFSGLALLRDEPVRVRDLRNPGPEIAELEKDHPGFKGHAGAGISRAMASSEDPRPLSLMVTRLKSDGRVLGFLRCWLAKDGPVYYLQEDASLLQQAAQVLTGLVDRLLRERRWGRVLVELGAVTIKAPFKAKDQSSEGVLLEGLVLIQQLMEIEGLDTLNSVRLLDPASNELYFAAYPKASVTGMGVDDFRSAIGRRFPLEGPAAKSRAAEVYRTRRPIFVPNITEGPQAEPSFPHVRQIIIAPILDSKGFLGVLDLRNRSLADFPDYALALASVLGHFLALQLRRERAEEIQEQEKQKTLQTQEEAIRVAAEKDREQREAFMDIAHQVKGPLSAARNRIELFQLTGRSAGRENLERIHTLLRRAELASKHVNLFADLARKGSIQTNGQTLQRKDFVTLARDLCADAQRQIPAFQRIAVSLDEESFSRHWPVELRADKELITHALNNVLDNARKYSDANTRINVFAGRSAKRFFVAVTNKGARIEPHETTLCKQRHWRKLGAGYTGEGAGLGLYVVDNIMVALSGSLDILPTGDDGVTEVRLNFQLLF